MQVRDLYLMISDLTDGGQILGYISATGHLDTQQQGIHISYGTPGHLTARDAARDTDVISA